jgi:glucose-6-phosphate 1-dehydrogenase
MTPLVFVIFGATGDLTSRKLMPALYSLVGNDKIPPQSAVIGVGRRALDNSSFRTLMKDSIKQVASDIWNRLADAMSYQAGDFNDPNLYAELRRLLDELDQQQGARLMRLYYLATPPEHYQTILTHLKDMGSKESKVLIEKPFGHNLETARALDQLLGNSFQEQQIYRIDHYLAKETVQNILAFRFANGIFEPTWNHEFIDHVQITVAEDIGIETRGNFYEGIGALRDVVQNHMMQMMSLVAMEQPRAFDAQSVRDERTKLIRSVIPFTSQQIESCIIRGQYVGYRHEKSVDPDSQTETFVALRCHINTPRWRGVPFYLRTGKKLGSKVTEISIHFKKPALCYDDVCLFEPEKVHRNVLTIRIAPDEQIALRLMVKQPGYGMNLKPVHMDFKYASSLPKDIHLDAYERLLIDAIVGDQMRFARTDEIEASWQIVSPILAAWKDKKVPLLPYQPGSLGPKAAEDLILCDQRSWYLH